MASPPPCGGPHGGTPAIKIEPPYYDDKSPLDGKEENEYTRLHKWYCLPYDPTEDPNNPMNREERRMRIQKQPRVSRYSELAVAVKKFKTERKHRRVLEVLKRLEIWESSSATPAGARARDDLWAWAELSAGGDGILAMAEVEDLTEDVAEVIDVEELELKPWTVMDRIKVEEGAGIQEGAKAGGCGGSGGIVGASGQAVACGAPSSQHHPGAAIRARSGGGESGSDGGQGRAAKRQKTSSCGEDTVTVAPATLDARGKISSSAEVDELRAELATAKADLVSTAATQAAFKAEMTRKLADAIAAAEAASSEAIAAANFAAAKLSAVTNKATADLLAKAQELSSVKEAASVAREQLIASAKVEADRAQAQFAVY